MSNLKLFGIGFPLQDGQFTVPQELPAGIDFINFQADFDGVSKVKLDMRVRINGAVLFEAAFEAVVHNVDNAWFPVDGEHMQDGSSVIRLVPDDVDDGHNYELLIGAVRFVKSNMETDSISAANGQFAFRAPALSGPVHGVIPVSVLFNEGTFHIDLSSQTLSMDEGFYYANTRATGEIIDAGGEYADALFLERLHVSQAKSVDLNQVQDSIEFDFEMEKTLPLELHVDVMKREREVSADNPMMTPMSVENYTLAVGLEKGASSSVQLSSLGVKPINQDTDMVVTFRSLGNEKNAPEMWTCTETIPLAFRVGTGRPSSLLLARTEHGVKLERLAAAGHKMQLHGSVAGVSYMPTEEAVLMCTRLFKSDAGDIDNAPIAPGLAAEETGPWLRFTQSVSVNVAKPGRSYRAEHAPSSGPEAAEYMTFTDDSPDGGAGVNLLPHAWSARHSGFQKDLYADINASCASLSYKMPTVRHESHMLEGPADPDNDNLQLVKLLREDGAKQAVQLKSPTLKAHNVKRTFGGFVVTHEVKEGEEADYVVIANHNMVELHKHNDEPVYFDLDSASKNFRVTGQPNPADGGAWKVVGFVKLTDRMTVSEILKALAKEGRVPPTIKLPTGETPIENLVDSSIDSHGWAGLIIFNIPINYKEFKILETMFGRDEKLVAPYLAFGATTPEGHFGVTGRLTWEAADQTVPNSDMYNSDLEANFQMLSVDVTWRDRKMVSFFSNSRCLFNTFFGMDTVGGENGTALFIEGSFDQGTGAIHFMGSLSQKLKILNEGGAGPIDQLYLKGAEIMRVDSKTTIRLDGDIKLKAFSFDDSEDWFQSGDDRWLDFRGLGLEIPEDGGPKRFLNIHYPSFSFNPDLPHFDFFGFEAIQGKITHVGMEREGSAFGWSSLVKLTDKGKPYSLPALRMGLRLKLMKLPEMFRKGFDDLIFDFDFGYGIQNRGLPTLDNFRAGLQGFGFSGLDFDLLGFLKVSADRIEFGTKKFPNTTESIPWLALQDANISILDKEIIKNLTLHLFSLRDGRSGFLGYLGEPFDTDILTINWALLGNNLQIKDDLAKEIISVKTLGEDISNELGEAYKKGELLPLVQRPNTREISEWIFAADIGLLKGFLTGKFLFQDNAYRGIALSGDVLEEWFGYELAIGVMHIMRDRPEEDSFFISLKIPTVTLPAFSFQGGILEFEIFMNGSFMLDCGFPRLIAGGGRDWRRAFGAIVGILQGSGGFYILRRSSQVAKGNYLVVGGGYAVQGGFGAAFGGGIFTVTVTAGIYYIIEGLLLLEMPEDGSDSLPVPQRLRGLYLAGACGVLVTGTGYLNFWIISATVRIVASAEARATLVWKHDPRLQLPSGSDDSVPPARVRLDLVLYARASARACIGRGWFKLCRGISVSTSMPFHHEFTL